MHRDAWRRRGASIHLYTASYDFSIQGHRSNLSATFSTFGGMADLGERGARKPPWSEVQVPPATSKTLMTARPLNRPGKEGFSDFWAQLGLEGSFCLSSYQKPWLVVLFYPPPPFFFSLVDRLGAKMVTLRFDLAEPLAPSPKQQSTEMKVPSMSIFRLANCFWLHAMLLVAPLAVSR